MNRGSPKRDRKIPGGVDLSELKSIMSGGAQSSEYNIADIDQVSELLSMNCQSYGLPDFGNLRSTKRKDVRARIKCI